MCSPSHPREAGPGGCGGSFDTTVTGRRYNGPSSSTFHFTNQGFHAPPLPSPSAPQVLCRALAAGCAHATGAWASQAARSLRQEWGSPGVAPGPSFPGTSGHAHPPSLQPLPRLQPRSTSPRCWPGQAMAMGPPVPPGPARVPLLRLGKQNLCRSQACTQQETARPGPRSWGHPVLTWGLTELQTSAPIPSITY